VSCWEAFASDITFTECMRSPPPLAFTHVDAHAAETLSPYSPRPHGVAMMVCFVHAAAGERRRLYGRFMHASPPAQPRTHAHSCPATGSLLVATVCTGPSSALAKMALRIWARGKTPSFRLIWTHQVNARAQWRPCTLTHRASDHSLYTVAPHVVPSPLRLSPVPSSHPLGLDRCTNTTRVHPCRLLTKPSCTSPPAMLAAPECLTGIPSSMF
jgi:hypothetical protein